MTLCSIKIGIDWRLWLSSTTTTKKEEKLEFSSFTMKLGDERNGVYEPRLLLLLSMYGFFFSFTYLCLKEIQNFIFQQNWKIATNSKNLISIMSKSLISFYSISSICVYKSKYEFIPYSLFVIGNSGVFFGLFIFRQCI